MEIMNKSIARNSSYDDEEEITLFAGRVLLVFYCLIFVFGLIGILEKKNSFIESIISFVFYVR
jgi:hypothetical protein